MLPVVPKIAVLYGVMNADHAVFLREVNTPYPYTADGVAPMLNDSEYPDPWVSIAMMAGATKQLFFSTSIYILPLRNPIEVAKATGTLALMSGNRFVLGAGIGWMKEEFEAYTVDFTRRGERHDECLDVLQLLWNDEGGEYHGKHFDFESLRILPAPTPAYSCVPRRLEPRSSASHSQKS